MKRFLLLACLAALASCAHSPEKKFNVVEATIPQMQQAMTAGTLTSRELIRLYLERIAAYDSKLNAVVTVNPRALEEADARDRDADHRRRLCVRGLRPDL
jgi:amidase